MALDDSFRDLNTTLQNASDDAGPCRQVLNSFFAILNDADFAAARRRKVHPTRALAEQLSTVLSAALLRQIPVEEIRQISLWSVTDYGYVYNRFWEDKAPPGCFLVYSQNLQKGAISVPLGGGDVAYKVFPAIGMMRTTARLLAKIRGFSHR